MKIIKTFENFGEWQGHLTDTDENDDFQAIIPKNKIDNDFEVKAESIANLILNCPEYSALKELALSLEIKENEADSKDYLSELEKCFPTLDFKKSQIVNTGTKIPFYGRVKNSAAGFVTGHPTDIYLPYYIAQKVQKPGYKY